jgi:hypothetical protein
MTRNQRQRALSLYAVMKLREADVKTTSFALSTTLVPLREKSPRQGLSDIRQKRLSNGRFLHPGACATN